MKIAIAALTYLAFLWGSCFAQEVNFSAAEGLFSVNEYAEANIGADCLLLDIFYHREVVLGSDSLIFDMNSGTADGWFYTFYDSKSDSSHILFARKDGTGMYDIHFFGGTANVSQQLPFIIGLSEGFLDTPILISLLRNNHLDTFISDHENVVVEDAYLFMDEWQIICSSNDASITCYIDALSGKIFSCDIVLAVENLAPRPDMRLLSVYPSPISLSTQGVLSIVYEASSHGSITLSLYDIVGHLLCTQSARIDMAGIKTLSLPLNHLFVAGTYLVIANMNGIYDSKPIVLVK